MRKGVIVGLLLVLIAVTFFIVKPPALLSIISRQDYIDPAQLTGEYNNFEKTGLFEDNPIVAPTFLAEASSNQQVLGTTDVRKRLEVDLSNQRIYAYENDTKVYDFLVSTGKWNRTPIGRFQVWIKLRYATMKGGNRALGTYYYLPNVPYTMYFYNEEHPMYEGYGIHGAYWHNNFGTPMSHGCINMAEADVKELFYWADPDLGKKPSIRATEENLGTEVIIFGESPKT